MEISSFLIRIIFLVIPGVITYLIYYRLVRRGARKDWESILKIMVFSLISYLILALIIKISNIFNPSTQIEFSIPSTSLVSLKVYDLLGREISVLVDEILISGNHIISFSGENLPSGIYLSRLQTPNGSIQRKMVLLR